jgi:hypothetical protein
MRKRSKENTFYENTFYSRERVLCKIYKRDSGQPATSKAAQQILSAVERCAKRRTAMAAKKRSGAVVGAAASRTERPQIADTRITIVIQPQLRIEKKMGHAFASPAKVQK